MKLSRKQRKAMKARGYQPSQSHNKSPNPIVQEGQEVDMPIMEKIEETPTSVSETKDERPKTKDQSDRLPASTKRDLWAVLIMLAVVIVAFVAIYFYDAKTDFLANTGEKLVEALNVQL